MKVKYFKPDSQLRNLIKWYWIMEMDAGESSAEQQFFPLGAIEIILHLQTPFLRLQHGDWKPEKNTFIEGQQPGVLKVKQAGIMKTVGITLYPWATFFLYKNSPRVFTNSSFHINDIDASINVLYEALLENEKDEDVAGLCDKYFLLSIKDKTVRYRSSDLVMIDLFKKPIESFKVGNLKREWKFSSKFFEKKFSELIGVSAGELMKKRRMNRAIQMMLCGDFISLTDVAYFTGYYDQSHFIKDFRVFFDSKPSGLLKKNHDLLKHFI